jgi:hypothetical protein
MNVFVQLANKRGLQKKVLQYALLQHLPSGGRNKELQQL